MTFPRRNPMQFSLRTLLLSVTSFAVLCSLFTFKHWNPVVFHSLLIFAIAAPFGSYGFDVGHTRRKALTELRQLLT